MWDRNADVRARLAPFERGSAPAGPTRGTLGNPGITRRHLVSGAERFKIVVRDAKTRHPRLPGYLCTLHRPSG